MEVKIESIVEEVAKHGVSAKTGKDWSMARVKLTNGQEVMIFNPVQPGLIVKEVQNGEFKNWQVVKADPKHEEIMTALRELYKLVKGLAGEGIDEN